MDRLDRAIQRSEEMFFEECDPGNIPIVVLFTKFDALVPVAMGELAPVDRQLPIQERKLKAKLLIEEIFNRADVWGRLSKMMYPPKSCVRIEGMHRSNEGCSSLLENTAAVLSEETLQMLFVSAQKTNVALCVRYAVWMMISFMQQAYWQMSPLPIYDIYNMHLSSLAFWFPHFEEWWVSCAVMLDPGRGKCRLGEVQGFFRQTSLPTFGDEDERPLRSRTVT